MNLHHRCPPSFYPHHIAAACLMLLAAMPQAGAQQGTSSPSPSEPLASLQAVEVKGQAARGGAAAYSTTALEAGDFAEAHASQVQDLLRKVPGMNVNNYQLSGVGDAIVLRGFGGGGHGGDVGVVLDGIPLNEAMSHADGYVDLNVIVPLEIERLTVYKGPVSALYGNFNRAGLIAIDTRKQGEYRQADLSLASHGTLDAPAALGLKLRDGEFLNLAAQHYRSDGFRAQSSSERSTAALRWSKQLTPRLELALSARLHHAEGDSPGYVTATQFATDPYGRDPRAMNDGARKNFATLRADTRYALTPQVGWLAFAYTTRQSFTRWFSRPVNAAPSAPWRQREESYERTVYGAGTSLNGRHVTALTPINWVAGLETFRESTDYLYYDGLQQRQRTAPAINDRDSRLDSLSAYAEVDAPIHRLLQLSAGLRWDRFTGGCGRNGPETGTDPCGPLARTAHASPKLGLRSQVAPGVLLRASWSEGFALPSNFAKYALGAAQLQPNIFRQTEVGAQFKPVAGLVLDVAAYRLQSTQEIRNTAPGVYENYGATRRTGVEASALWAVRKDLDLEVAWGSAQSRVTENGNPALVGRQVAGVPRHTATVALAWRPLAQWETTLTWRRVGRHAVNADNSVVYGGYATWDLGLSYRLPGARSRIYAMVGNLTDKAYATSSSVIGGTQLFAPGAPRTLKVGVQAQF